MPDELITSPSDVPADLPSYDTTVAHPARVYNYWLGGKDNFEADREVGDRTKRAYPGIVAGVQMQRQVLASAVRYLVTEAGIRQFLDIGTGLPAVNNTHEVAQALAPESRVVYVDNDPMVLAHARALLTSRPAGACAYLDADIRATKRLLAAAGGLLDFTKPVALMLVGVLQLIPDSDDPAGIVAQLIDRVPSGSWLVIVHPANDVAVEQMATMVKRYNEGVPTTTTLRNHAQVSDLFHGMELLTPGVVQLNQWHPGEPAQPASGEVPAYVGLARKP